METTPDEIMAIKPYVETNRKKGRAPQHFLVRKSRVNGKVKRVWSKYLGTAETIEKFYVGREEHTALKLRSFEYGRTAALMKIAEELNFVEIVNKHTTKKRVHGLTVGEYMLLIILSRADRPTSKNRISEWFQESFLSLIWSFPHKLNTKNFTNHMGYLIKNHEEAMQKIEDDVGRVLVEKNGMKPSTLFFDTTNFFTHHHANNNGGKLLGKGKSKEKRHDKNLVGLALATSDENIPLFHESYPGGDHDAKVFGEIFDKIVKRLDAINVPCKNIVMVFDRGCNSGKNIEKVVTSKMHVVGALRRDQVPDLFDIPLEKYDFLYANKKKHEVKGYRTTKKVFETEFTVVMSYNEGSCKKQAKTYDNKKATILEKLEKIKKSVERIGRGRKKSVKNALIDASKAVRNYEGAFRYDCRDEKEGGRRCFDYGVDTDGEKKLRSTFGKNPIFTDKRGWSSERIVKTYNRKDLVEKDFMWLKDTLLIPIKPVYLQKDDHIEVHNFLCVMGLVFYRYLMWKLKKQNEPLSKTKIIEKLEKIRIAVVGKDNNEPAKLKSEEMDLDQMRLFTAIGLGNILKDVNF